jgi:hypothetical protein
VINYYLRSGRLWFLPRENNEEMMMEGYSGLRSRVLRFLNDNPDVQTLTLKRPLAAKRRVYENPNSECYGRMPESCPIVTAILKRCLPDDLKIVRIVEGVERPVDPDQLRDEIFTEIHGQVTSPFRKALEDVCEQKHRLLSQLKGHQRELREWIENAQTELPPDEPPRKRSRREAAENIEFEIEDDDSSPY